MPAADVAAVVLPAAVAVIAVGPLYATVNPLLGSVRAAPARQDGYSCTHFPMASVVGVVFVL